MPENTRVLLIRERPNEGNDRGLFVDDPPVVNQVVKAALASKPTEVLAISLKLEAQSIGEEELKAMFPDASPPAGPGKGAAAPAPPGQGGPGAQAKPPEPVAV